MLSYFIDMENTSRKPYIYKVTNYENHQYYIGSQCSGKIIGHNYFTSSTNKAFKEGFKTYGEEKYKIAIIKEFEDPKKCVRIENYIIRNCMQLKDGLCLNKACCCGGEKIFSTVGLHHTPWNKGRKGISRSGETRKKISIARKGTHPSEETRKKISIARKGTHLSEETKQKLSITLKGRKGTHLSEETKQKISTARKGIPRSEEEKQKLRKALQGRPSPNRKKISIEDIIFDSLVAASKYYNVHKETIRYWLKTKKHNAFLIEK